MTWSDIKPILDDYVFPIAGALVLIVISFYLANYAQRLAERALNKAELDKTLSTFLSKLVRWVVLILALLSSLSYFGVETTSFAAVIGAAGLAVGLALQGTLSNAAAGVMLLVFRPFSVGDMVSIGGITGGVKEISLFTTALDTLDNRRYIVPNSQIFGQTIENITFHKARRVDVTVGVSYDADIDEVRKVLQEVAESVEPQIEERPPQIVMTGLGDSAVDFQVRVWVDPVEYFGVHEQILIASKKKLDAAGIGIPYPQMDLHVLEMPEAS